jgi:cytochrome c biogenesis protein CcdA
VLPILPILLASAAVVHPRASLALALGLALSYAAIGTALASVGASLGLDSSALRLVGAGLLGLAGVVLMSSRLQQRFASAVSGVGDAGNTLISNLRLDGLAGQFVIGLLLGVVWSPCVGPTLGAATLLASQGSHLPQVALLMTLFGIGAALPIVVLAQLSRGAVSRSRNTLLQAGKAGKTLLGAAMLLIALLVLTGLNKSLEAWLVQVSPDWLTTLTTRF